MSVRPGNVRLGRTNLRVSPVAYGTWELSGHWGAFDEAEAIAAIRHARELGVNIFDTAHAYGWGAAERLLGQALRDDLKHRRDEVVIVAKGGMRISDGGARYPDSSPEWLRVGLEGTLAALGVDHVDVYLVHLPDKGIPFADTAGFLRELVEAGTIRHVGVSNHDVSQVAEFAATLPVEVVQSPYNVFRRHIADADLPYATVNDIGVMAYAPLANGLLSGAVTVDGGLPDGDWRNHAPAFQGERLRKTLTVVDRLGDLARTQLGVSVAQLALAWTLANPAVHTTVVGTRRPKHIQEAVHAADLSLSEGDLREIDRVIAEARGE
jgi:aryl-alcohol dehydrogenase-like predicted oxidoreductase